MQILHVFYFQENEYVQWVFSSKVTVMLVGSILLY